MAHLFYMFNLTLFTPFFINSLVEKKNAKRIMCYFINFEIVEQMFHEFAKFFDVRSKFEFCEVQN